MNHKTLLQMLSAYSDGYTNESQRATVLSHLETCSECRKFLREQKQMKAGIHEAADFHLHHAFSAKIMASIQATEAMEIPWMGVEPSARNTVFALAVAVVMLIAVTVFGGTQQEFDAQHLLTAGMNDSLANNVLMHQTELSKDDVMLAVMTK
ncbi:MAG TPA: zf-HC2 domain-containing protein [Bacteroidota bacterium]|nr:zf-HC2 domain-containing protein [Bacteroidota bacterium]